MGNYINAKITMSAQPNQDGHCGNFNGNEADDDRLQIRARIGTTGVEANMLILPGAKIPIGQSNRPASTIVQGKSWNILRLHARQRSINLFPQWNVSLILASEGTASLAGVLRDREKILRDAHGP